MEFDDKETLMTSGEAAKYLRVHWMTVSRWCKDGVVPAAKIGKNWRIKKADLEKWFRGKVKTNGRYYQEIS